MWYLHPGVRLGNSTLALLQACLRLIHMWLHLALTSLSSGEWPAINLTYYLWKVTTEEWRAKSNSRVSRELQAAWPGLRLSGQAVALCLTLPQQSLSRDSRQTKGTRGFEELDWAHTDPMGDDSPEATFGAVSNSKGRIRLSGENLCDP